MIRDPSRRRRVHLVLRRDLRDHRVLRRAHPVLHGRYSHLARHDSHSLVDDQDRVSQAALNHHHSHHLSHHSARLADVQDHVQYSGAPAAKAAVA